MACRAYIGHISSCHQNVSFVVSRFAAVPGAVADSSLRHLQTIDPTDVAAAGAVGSAVIHTVGSSAFSLQLDGALLYVYI